jgi:hypothetical protein
MNIYKENGYDSRKDYLTCIADDYGLEVADVFTVASILGSSEDFDGLLSSLEDMAEY